MLLVRLFSEMMLRGLQLGFATKRTVGPLLSSHVVAQIVQQLFSLCCRPRLRRAWQQRIGVHCGMGGARVADLLRSTVDKKLVASAAQLGLILLSITQIAFSFPSSSVVGFVFPVLLRQTAVSVIS